VGWSSGSLAALLGVAACSGGGGPSPAAIDGGLVDAATDARADAGEHAARFIGLWAVEQPFHALYEVTYYGLAADGVVTIGPSEPADCSGHLERHCVTGSVARCTPTPPQDTCQGTPTCLFGDRWRSTSDRIVVLAGVCSDGVARDIAIELDAATGDDSDWNGAGATVLTVGGETGWSHDNWTWSFRKCPPGTAPATCFP
jgi:hypothetical protein